MNLADIIGAIFAASIWDIETCILFTNTQCVLYFWLYTTAIVRGCWCNCITPKASIEKG